MKSSPDTIPRFLQLFINFRFSTFHDFRRRHETENELKKVEKVDIFAKSQKSPKTPKPDHPKKVDFGPFRPSLYRPIRTGFRDGAKMVIFEGSRPQNRKKPFFCKKKRKVEEKKKGFEVSTCFAIIICSPTRASDPLLIQ